MDSYNRLERTARTLFLKIKKWVDGYILSLFFQIQILQANIWPWSEPRESPVSVFEPTDVSRGVFSSWNETNTREAVAEHWKRSAMERYISSKTFAFQFIPEAWDMFWLVSQPRETFLTLSEPTEGRFIFYIEESGETFMSPFSECKERSWVHFFNILLVTVFIFILPLRTFIPCYSGLDPRERCECRWHMYTCVTEPLFQWPILWNIRYDSVKRQIQMICSVDYGLWVFLRFVWSGVSSASLSHL